MRSLSIRRSSDRMFPRISTQRSIFCGEPRSYFLERTWATATLPAHLPDEGQPIQPHYQENNRIDGRQKATKNPPATRVVTPGSSGLIISFLKSLDSFAHLGLHLSILKSALMLPGYKALLIMYSCLCWLSTCVCLGTCPFSGLGVAANL